MDITIDSSWVDLLNSLSEGVVVRDAGGRVIFWNRAAERILGLSAEQLRDVDRHWPAWDARREDGSPFPRESYPADVVLRTGQPQNGVVIGLERPDGWRAWLSVDTRPMSKDGQVAGVFTVVTDITEQRRAEEALRQRNRYIDSILEQAPIGFAVHTINDGVGRFVTARFEEIYGVPRGTIDSHYTFFDKVWRNDPIVREQIQRRVVEDMTSGDPARMHWENVPVRMDDGETRFINAMNIPLHDQNLMVSTVQDVTDRVRAEAERRRLWDELSQAQKMESVGRLAGGIAHDFNNILADITMQLGLAKARFPQIGDAVEEIRIDADLGATLIRQLLVFSRRSPIDVRPIDLNSVAGGLMNMLRRLLGERIAVRFEPSAEPAGVRADASMVEQVVMNLAVNAGDAMPDGGTVTIAITPGGEFTSLSVADTGAGMDEATLARAFEPFFTTKPAGKGTGLGLSIVQGIVAQHDGRVEAESVPGQGTTLRVFLPSAPLQVSRVERPIRQPLLTGHGTILLVEDFARLREKMAAALHLLGYEVIQAGSGDEALRIWDEHRSRIDLLYTDISLPGRMNGLQVADALHASKPSLRVILSSGYGDDLVDESRLAAGMVYLHKPCDLETMARTIRQCFDAVGQASTG